MSAITGSAITGKGGGMETWFTGVIGGFLVTMMARIFFEGARVRNWQSEEIGRLNAEVEHIKTSVARFETEIADERRQKIGLQEENAKLRLLVLELQEKYIGSMSEKTDLYSLAEHQKSVLLIQQHELSQNQQSKEDASAGGRRKEDQESAGKGEGK